MMGCKPHNWEVRIEFQCGTFECGRAAPRSPACFQQSATKPMMESVGVGLVTGPKNKGFVEELFVTAVTSAEAAR
jgi:hypothetical protein